MPPKKKSSTTPARDTAHEEAILPDIETMSLETKNKLLKQFLEAKETYVNAATFLLTMENVFKKHRLFSFTWIGHVEGNLSDEALEWFQEWYRDNQPGCWDEFTEAFMARFEGYDFNVRLLDKISARLLDKIANGSTSSGGFIDIPQAVLAAPSAKSLPIPLQEQSIPVRVEHDDPHLLEKCMAVDVTRASALSHGVSSPLLSLACSDPPHAFGPSGGFSGAVHGPFGNGNQSGRFVEQQAYADYLITR